MVRLLQLRDDNIVSYYGVHIPISHFTLTMDYYPPALPFIVISKEIYQRPKQDPMTIKPRLSFICHLLQRLGRHFIIEGDHVIDITPHKNIFANNLEIDSARHVIASTRYIDKKQYRYIPKEHIWPQIDKLPPPTSPRYYEDVVMRIVRNTIKLQAL